MKIRQIDGIRGRTHAVEDRLVYHGDLTILAEGVSNQEFMHLCDLVSSTLSATPCIWNAGSYLPYDQLQRYVETKPLTEVLFYPNDGGVLMARLHMATPQALERLMDTAFVFAALPVAPKEELVLIDGKPCWYCNLERKDAFDPSKPNFLAAYFYNEDKGLQLVHLISQSPKLVQ